VGICISLLQIYLSAPHAYKGLVISEPKLYAANVIGLTLSISYFFAFAKLTPPGSASLPGTLQQHIQGFVSILASVLWMVKTKKKGMLGKLGVAINMAMYGSPLAAIKTVLESKSSESIPLPMTVATLISCALWAITGILEMKDPYVWIPSIVGIAFGLMQVGLKLAFVETGGAVSNLSPDLNSQKMVLK
jgi:solute carrier family 50 (sugar transporter)